MDLKKICIETEKYIYLLYYLYVDLYTLLLR